MIVALHLEPTLYHGTHANVKYKRRSVEETRTRIRTRDKPWNNARCGLLFGFALKRNLSSNLVFQRSQATIDVQCTHVVHLSDSSGCETCVMIQAEISLKENLSIIQRNTGDKPSYRYRNPKWITSCTLIWPSWRPSYCPSNSSSQQPAQHEPGAFSTQATGSGYHRA